jgi:hypothetical protein
MGRGRKPASSRGKKAQWTVYLTPEEVEFLEGRGGGPGREKEGLYQLLRQAIADTGTEVGLAGWSQPAVSPAKREPAGILLPIGWDGWCERCRRLGMAICLACKAQNKGKH